MKIRDLIDLAPFRKHRDWCARYPTCHCDLKDANETVDKIGEVEISTASVEAILKIVRGKCVNDLSADALLNELTDIYYLIPKKRKKP